MPCVSCSLVVETRKKQVNRHVNVITNYEGNKKKTQSSVIEISKYGAYA